MESLSRVYVLQGEISKNVVFPHLLLGRPDWAEGSKNLRLVSKGLDVDLILYI